MKDSDFNFLLQSHEWRKGYGYQKQKVCKIECEMEYDISDSSRVKSVSCFKLQRFYSSKKSFRVHKVKYVSTHTEQDS